MKFMKPLALAVGMAALVSWGASGQPPPGGGPNGFKGGKGAKAGNPNSEQLIEDFKLTDAQRRKARDILRGYDDKMRQTVRQARQDMLGQMKEVLNEGDYKAFKEELDQVPLLPPIPPNLRTVSDDDLVEHLMSYDKNGDGKITKDELPERMHSLIEQGDRNGDGALDREEIKRLVDRGRLPGGPPGGGPRGPGGPGGPRGPGGPPRGPGGPPPQ
jgi:hypothetical protein